VLCFTEPEAHASARAATTAQAAAPRYARHDPERTLLYALVQAHYPDFLARLEAEGAEGATGHPGNRANFLWGKGLRDTHKTKQISCGKSGKFLMASA